MDHLIITPEDASKPKPISLEEQLHQAVNSVLYSRYKETDVTVYQEEIQDLIGHRRWNVAEHPRTLAEIIQRYASAGWHIFDSSPNPHRQSWTFKAQAN